MKPLRLGLAPWGQGREQPALLETLLRQAELAERLGFDSLFVPESHFEPAGSLPAPLLLLGAIAARTRRIALGTTSYLLSVRHPIRVAEDVAVLDHLSGGRVILGVGRGFRESLFKAFDVPVAEKRDRFEATLAAVLRAWRGEPIATLETRDGAIARVPLRVTPATLQKPHPPIWVAAFGPKALAQAGRLGLPYFASPLEPLAALIENCARHRAALPAGTSADALDVPVIRSIFATQDAPAAARVREALAAQARALARSGRRFLARNDLDDVDGWALIGEPARVAEHIESYRERLGLTHLVARVQVPGAAPAEIEASLHLLAELGAGLRKQTSHV